VSTQETRASNEDHSAAHDAWLHDLAADNPFGKDDKLGSINLIDDSARLRAVRAVTSARSVSLARPIASAKSWRKDGHSTFDVEFFDSEHSGVSVRSDHVQFDCHGGGNTHIDALNHLGKDRTWYNNWPLDDKRGPAITDYALNGIITRAVHVDIPAVRGTEWVEVEHPVTGNDIDVALREQGIVFEFGDALLLDMGRDRFEAAGHLYYDPENAYSSARPGVGRDGAEWIARHGVSVLCWDFLDAILDTEPDAAVHYLIWAIGLALVDNCDFAALRQNAKHGAAGALVIAPLAIPGGTGCNVNPIVLL
jgi:kynurenine formamidase